MAGNYVSKVEKAKQEAAERRASDAARVQWLERRLDWLVELGERFKARDYAPDVVESLVKTNDAEIDKCERELAGLRRATI